MYVLTIQNPASENKTDIHTNWKRTITPQTHNFFCTNSGILNLFRQIHLMYTYMWHFPVNRIVYFDCKSFFCVNLKSRDVDWPRCHLFTSVVTPSVQIRGERVFSGSLSRASTASSLQVSVQQLAVIPRTASTCTWRAAHIPAPETETPEPANMHVVKRGERCDVVAGLG